MYRNLILKNVTWLSLSDILPNILGIFFYIILARELGQQGLGLYSYLFAVMGFVSLLLDPGIMSNYWRKWTTDESSLKKDFSQILAIRLILLLPISIVVLIYILLSDKALLSIFLLAYIFTFLEIFRSIPISYLNAKNFTQKSFYINFVDRFFSLGLGIVFLLHGATLTQILLLFIFTRILSLLLAFLFVPIFIKPDFKFNSLKIILLESFPIFIFTFLNTFYFKIDNILIKNLVGIDQVGAYNASYRLLDSIMIFPTIIVYSVFPTFSKLHHQKNHDLLNVLQILTKFLTALSLFIGLFFTIYASRILDLLYGQVFKDSERVLFWLGWSSFLIFLNLLIAYYLYALKQEKFLIKRLLILTLVNIILNILLIPFWGITGSAIATFLTELIGLVILYSHIKINFFGWWVLKILLALGSTFILMINLHDFILVDLFIELAFFGIILFLLKIHRE